MEAPSASGEDGAGVNVASLAVALPESALHAVR